MGVAVGVVVGAAVGDAVGKAVGVAMGVVVELALLGSAEWTAVGVVEGAPVDTVNDAFAAQERGNRHLRNW